MLLKLIIVIAISFIPTKRDVRYTSYWQDSVTASGLTIDDFKVNENGWYTYNDKVVVATATTKCLESDKGICGKYMDIPSHYDTHNLYDEITLHINDVEYEAIVLDVCGACFWHEEYQRYDIMVSSEEHAYTGLGVVEYVK